MKKILSILLLLLAVITVRAEVKTVLSLQFKGGGEISFVLDDRPVLKFNGRYLIVATMHDETTYDLKNVACYKFAEKDVDSILDVTIDNCCIDAVAQNKFEVYGEQIANVYIHDEQGNMLYHNKITSNTLLDLNAFPAGVYIISLQGSSTIVNVKYLKK